MIVKGFIDYNASKIPFVLKDYKLELFSQNESLNAFVKEHNFKHKYILTGQYFRSGSTSENITILVERSMGTTCYVTCYILERLRTDSGFDCINFQSRSLDSVTLSYLTPPRLILIKVMKGGHVNEFIEHTSYEECAVLYHNKKYFFHGLIFDQDTGKYTFEVELWDDKNCFITPFLTLPQKQRKSVWKIFTKPPFFKANPFWKPSLIWNG